MPKVLDVDLQRARFLRDVLDEIVDVDADSDGKSWNEFQEEAEEHLPDDYPYGRDRTLHTDTD